MRTIRLITAWGSILGASLIIILFWVLYFGRMDHCVTARGSIIPASVTAVMPEIGGIVGDVRVSQGSVVLPGDTLLVIKSDELEYAVTSARCTLTGAKLQLTEYEEEYKDLMVSSSFETSTVLVDADASHQKLNVAKEKRDRARQLYEKGFVSDELLAEAELDVLLLESNIKALKDRRGTLIRRYARLIEESRTRVELAERSLEHAEKKLEKMVIVSPVGGTVLTNDLQDLVGAKVGEGQTVIEIGDLSRTTFLASVSEVDISHIRIGQRSRVSFTAYKGYEEYLIEGEVVDISDSPIARQSVSSYGVKIALKSPIGQDLNTEPCLKLGMTGQTDITVGEDMRLIDILFEAVFR